MRPAPENLAEMANAMNRAQLRRELVAGNKTLDRWFAETGISYPCKFSGKPVKEMPLNFEAIQAGKTVKEICAYFGCGKLLARRWLKAIGVCRGEVRVNAKPKAAKVVPIRRTAEPFTMPVDRYQRDTTEVGLAVEDLRRDRWSVHPCDEKKRFNVNGPYWLVGTARVDRDELLERAERARRRMVA